MIRLIALLCLLVLPVRGSTWFEWQIATFSAPQLADSTVSGREADPNADGVPNFLAYALGLPAFGTVSPAMWQSKMPQLGWVRADGTEWRTTVPPRTDPAWHYAVRADVQPDRSDVQAVGEGTVNLGSVWSQLQPMGGTPPVWRDPAPWLDRPVYFLRLRVTYSLIPPESPGVFPFTFYSPL